MTNLEISVILSGIGLIGLIIYYFFGPKSESETATIVNKKQAIMVTVDAAYDPEEIRVKVNVPVEIVFDRKDKGDCTEWVSFGKLPTKEGREIKARLPEGQKTSLRFTPIKVGVYRFECGMGMVHGKLIVEK